MSEEDKIKLENELLLTKSKAQMINLYLDLQQKVEQLENIIKEAIEYIDGHTFYYTDTPYDLLDILNKGYYKNEIKGE